MQFQSLIYAHPPRPCRSHLCSRTSTEGAAVITGTGWRRGGGPATWARWSMARASASTLDGSRALKARGSSRSRRLPATTSRAQWGCIGACQKGRRRAVSDRTAAWRTSRTKNRAGRQATGILKTLRAGPWRPAPLLFDSAKTFARERPGDLARLSPFAEAFAEVSAPRTASCRPAERHAAGHRLHRLEIRLARRACCCACRRTTTGPSTSSMIATSPGAPTCSVPSFGMRLITFAGIDRRHRDHLLEREAEAQELAHHPGEIRHARRVAGEHVDVGRDRVGRRSPARSPPRRPCSRSCRRRGRRRRCTPRCLAASAAGSSLPSCTMLVKSPAMLGAPE